MSFILPPEIPNHFSEGLPTSPHKVHKRHPLEIHLIEERENSRKVEQNINSALFGIGFVKELNSQLQIIEKSQITYTAHTRPSDLGEQIFTGKIDDLDFPDMFAPDGMRPDVNFDPHSIQEVRIFKRALF